MRIRRSRYAGQVWGAAFLCAVAVFSGACKRFQEDAPILPPPTPPLSRPVIGYGVISASYTHVAAEPGEGEVSLGYLRKSSIVEVLERRAVNNEGVWEAWVLVRGTYQGWLRESVIQIYDNEAQARTATESHAP